MLWKSSSVFQIPVIVLGVPVIVCAVLRIFDVLPIVSGVLSLIIRTVLRVSDVLIIIFVFIHRITSCIGSICKTIIFIPYCFHGQVAIK
jgi:hypothetical protein